MSRPGPRGDSLRTLTALFILTIFTLATSGGAGQASKSALQHEVTVTLKLIQVFVTGSDGKPALDLDKSDFTLTDNGKPQTITDFESHVLVSSSVGRPAPAPAPAPPPKAEAPLLSRKFIFLIDYVRNGLEGVQKAKAAALEFLDSKVGPDDEVALFTLSPMSGLRQHEYLTKDHDKIRAAFKKLRHLPVGGSGDLPSRDLTGMELLNAQVFAPHGGHAGPTQRNLFEDIAEWAKALRAIPGQKNIILFTTGFGNAAVRPGRLNNVLFEAMARALASANAPVFTVDTTPQALPGRDVEDKLPSGTLTERSLAYLSQTTGGKYLGGVNFSARIATDIEDATAKYYVLGYYIPATWDGKYHEVKVEVRRPKYVVHAQRGYFNPVPFEKLTPLEKHLHLLQLALGESPSAEQAPRFPLIAVPFPEGGGTEILLLSEIPAALRESIGDRSELVSLILNEGNAIVDGKRADIDGKGLGAGTVYQYGVAAIEPGRYECRAVLRNLDDGRAAVGSCVVEVAAPLAEGPMMFPPLLLVQGSSAKYLNFASPRGGSEAQDFSISTIFPFPAKAYVPLVGPLDKGATSLCAELICLWRGDRGREKDLSASLRLEGSEEEVPITTELLAASSRDDKDFYLLSFELPTLAPGRYRLEIKAEDTATGSTVRTEGRFTVSGRGSS